MRVPRDPENWTGWHVDRAIEIARRLFDVYETKLDLDKPQQENDDWYNPYYAAREQAIELARYTNYRTAEAEALP